MQATLDTWAATPFAAEPTVAEVQLDALLHQGMAYAHRRDHLSPQHKLRMAQFMKLQEEAALGYPLQQYTYREVLTTSDFGLLFGDVLDKKMLGQYAAWPTVWPGYVKRGAPLTDFRTVKRFALDGFNGLWEPQYRKPENTNVQYDNNIALSPYSYAPVQYEKGYAITWQSLVNDDLNALDEIPGLIAEGGRRTQDFIATAFYAEAAGPKTTIYNAGNRNLVNTTNGAAVNNAPLTLESLEDAWMIMRNQRDPVNNQPIIITAAVLVVPPALEMTARHILFGQQVTFGGSGQTARGGTAGVSISGDNPLRNSVRLVVNPYLPYVTTTANVGNTAWYLFADPDQGRPAIELSFLRSFDTPQLYRKKSDMEAVGGGGGGPDYMMGDFESGAIYYKAVQVMGGNVVDPKATVASFGTGT
jgi:Mu-like prophage major head subunit gpT